jgi:hypothetical protein
MIDIIIPLIGKVVHGITLRIIWASRYRLLGLCVWPVVVR